MLDGVSVICRSVRRFRQKELQTICFSKCALADGGDVCQLGKSEGIAGYPIYKVRKVTKLYTVEYQRVRGAIGGMDGSGMGIRPGAHRRDRDRRAAGMGHGDGRAKCN